MNGTVVKFYLCFAVATTRNGRDLALPCHLRLRGMDMIDLFGHANTSMKPLNGLPLALPSQSGQNTLSGSNCLGDWHLSMSCPRSLGNLNRFPHQCLLLKSGSVSNLSGNINFLHLYGIGDLECGSAFIAQDLGNRLVIKLRDRSNRPRHSRGKGPSSQSIEWPRPPVPWHLW